MAAQAAFVDALPPSHSSDQHNGQSNDAGAMTNS